MGNPITIQSGAKIESATDFETADGLFNLTRYYRSFTSTNTESYHQEPIGLANNWRFGFSWEVHIDEGFYTNDDVTLHAPDGSAYNFERTDDSQMSPKAPDASQVNVLLSFVGEWPDDLKEIRERPTRWAVRDTDNTVYLLETVVAEYNDDQRYYVGRPISITGQNGYQQTLSYGDYGQLETITDSYGRQMVFEWDYGERTDSGNVRTIPLVVSRVSFPDGSSAEYGYEATYSTSQNYELKERLSSTLRQDTNGSVVDSTQYHYENESFPYALTGITDHRGVRVSSWGYDEFGRATYSEGANGVNRTTITYDDSDSPLRIIRNPLGKKAVYRYQRYGRSSNPSMRLTVVDGKPSANCVESRRRISYNDDGFYSFTEDEEGNLTRYRYDDNERGLPNRIYEAAGTEDERLTKISWNIDLRKPTRIADSSLETKMYYDDLGRLIKVIQTDLTTHTTPYSTAGQKRIWYYGYSDSGQLLYVEQPLPGTVDRVYYSYDDQGYLSRIVDELDHVTRISSVNERGQPTNVVDPNGIRTKYTYDTLGRLIRIKIESGDNPTWRFSYDEVGNLIVIKRPDGSYLRYSYDDANRLRKIHNNANEAIYYSRDAMGNVIDQRIKDTGNNLVYRQQQTFDELGRLLSTIGANTQTWSYRYNRVNDLLSIEDPTSNTFSYGYDGLRRIIDTTNEEQAISVMQHDEQDNLVGYIDPRNVTTTYIRNGWGEIIQENSPDRGAMDYVRNERGWITQRKDARGKITNYTHDSAGRVLSVSYPADSSINLTYSYDDTANGNRGISRLTRINDSTGSTAYQYDGQGNMVQARQRIGSIDYVTGYQYLNDQISVITYPSGLSVKYLYDNVGRVSSIAAERNGQILPLIDTIEWKPFGPITRMNFANGVFETRTQDLSYRLGRLQLSTAIGDSVNQQYIYSDGKYVTTIDDLLSPVNSQSYGYSPTGRLTHASGPWGNIDVSYDTSGNRLSYSDSVTAQALVVQEESNRLLGLSGTESISYDYDESGNRTLENGNNVAKEYQYNDSQHLTAVTENGVTVGSYVVNAYNQLSIRTTQAGTRHYLYGLDGLRLLEADSNGSIRHEYIWLGNRPVAYYDYLSNQMFSIHTDHLDRPVALTDANGNTVWIAAWKPWGEPYEIASSGATDLKMRFPGQWETEENGLFYNWHRYYDSNTGRYTQSDPIGMDGGDNIYLYANANPLNYVDRDGLAPHKKNKRPSSLNKHQGGDKRRAMDRGGEKGDKNRDLNRKRPKGYKGAWPPKTGLFPLFIIPPALLDPCIMGIGECDEYCT